MGEIALGISFTRNNNWVIIKILGIFRYYKRQTSHHFLLEVYIYVIENFQGSNIKLQFEFTRNLLQIIVTTKTTLFYIWDLWNSNSLKPDHEEGRESVKKSSVKYTCPYMLLPGKDVKFMYVHSWRGNLTWYIAIIKPIEQNSECTYLL